MKNNNMPGFMNNLPVMGMNNLNMGMNLPQNFAATPTNQILPNINGFNPNFNLRGPQNTQTQPNFQNQAGSAHGYNFKQRDTPQPPTLQQPNAAQPSSAGNVLKYYFLFILDRQYPVDE
jgi:hypothetical protein